MKNLTPAEVIGITSHSTLLTSHFKLTSHSTLLTSHFSDPRRHVIPVDCYAAHSGRLARLQIGAVGRDGGAVEEPEAYFVVAVGGMAQGEHTALTYRRCLGGAFEEVRPNLSIAAGHAREPFVARLRVGLQQYWRFLVSLR